MNELLGLAELRAAASAVDAVFLRTPVATSAALDAALGCEVLLKIETANPIGSFKGRGAEWFAATALRPGEAVVCASAGNFGQGLARACVRRGHACTVFVARTANPLKVEALRRLGADLRVAGADFDAAKSAARAHAAERGLRFVEDGLEPALAEGAGTIGLELADGAPFDVIALPLGNGALLAGIGSAMRQLRPAVEIVAVVARNAPAMKRLLEAGRVVETEQADTIADGIAVRVPIVETLPLLRSRRRRIGSAVVRGDAPAASPSRSARRTGRRRRIGRAAGAAGPLRRAPRRHRRLRREPRRAAAPAAVSGMTPSQETAR